ncbi:MAG TPA: cytochrome c biogenesis protein CcdA [Bacteroidales bacterium]|nr:cytochrome c biogenesis protein CcdA [Bacteroidales bacterium]
MVKRALLIVIILSVTVSSFSQIFNPVTWQFGHEKTGEREYELIFTATIEEGSHIYSLDIPSGGPIPTSFSIDTSGSFSLVGEVYEVTKPEEVFDEAFQMNIKSFSKSAEFRQKITVKKPSLTVTGTLNYMVCNNVSCSPPQDLEFEIPVGQDAKQPLVKSNLPVDGQPRRGLLAFFLISLLAGFAGVLTPCVFPMIPMTVAFFSRGSDERHKAVMNAVMFGLSIILIYSSLGIIVSLTSAGAGFANTLSSHWIPNTIFFLLFVIFAISFFGAFEIVLPNSWIAKADSRVDRGGVFSSFFMGLTTVIVSFSCTGPIIGALLVEAASGDVIRPTLGMFGFGIAFALPFTLFALFPSVMNRIPKSGGWLNSIKVVLGFIMLAFSLRFLTTVDSVYSLGLISRDLFIAIWIVLFSLLGLYLMGKIKFAHDSELPYIGTFRLFLIIAVFTFVIYLVPGMFGSPLKALSSFLPSSKSELSLSSTAGMTYSPANSPVSGSQQCQVPKFGDKLSMPLGLSGYFDYKQGLACAKELGKPVLLDFKGHACANCKLMEARVWSDPVILDKLKEFVIIGLYLDDRTPLPENEWVKSALDGKVKKTIGKINEDLEISKFRTNAMPLYVITDHEGNPLVQPMATNLNVAEYGQWLDDGIAAFRNKNNGYFNVSGAGIIR